MPERRPESANTAQGWAGLGLIAVSVFLLMCLVSYDWRDIRFYQDPPNAPPRNLFGIVGAWMAFQFFWALGITAFLLPAVSVALGLFLLFRTAAQAMARLGWMVLGLLAMASLVEFLHEPLGAFRDRYNLFSPGGTFGHLIGPLFVVRLLGKVGGAIFLSAVFLFAAVLLLELQPRHLIEQTRAALSGVWARFRSRFRAAKGQESFEEELELARRRRAAARRGRDDREEAGGGAAEPETREEAETPARRRPDPRPEPAKPAPVVEILPDAHDDEEPLEIRLPEPPPPDPEPEPVRIPVAAPAPPPPAWQQPVQAAKPGAGSRKAAADAALALPELSETGPLAAAPAHAWVLPNIHFLQPVPEGAAAQAVGHGDEAALLLEATLKEFGIEAKVTNIEKGPVVTSFEVLPAPGVRVEKIANLSKNIALKLKAESIRVQAPIPGKGVVGIEIPNPKSAKVVIRQILEAPEWKNSKAALPLVIGIDVSGRKIVADLAEMPHLLIAGATGSGKSVCMNSLLAGLLMSRSPDQLRMILVDPKIVEFKSYNDLPHLVVPVITDPKKVALGLRWAINEMEKRYKLFAKAGVRNIKAYNARPPAQQQNLFGLEEGAEPPPDQPPARLPYIIIVIDELADLMLQVKAEVENSIARLAQLSRAVGIHMILATQRPTVNVITGTIKANFPCRIAFKVAQSNDSRTILDANGADALLGKGDMLFLPPGVARLLRAQGALTTDDEINKIVDFLKAQGEPAYESAIKDKLDGTAASPPAGNGSAASPPPRPAAPAFASSLPGSGEAVDFSGLEEDNDEALINAAVQIIKETRRASTSSLQRRLRIGYNRAARLMDQLQERGVVGPPQGSDPREILIDLEGEIPDNPKGDGDASEQPGG